MSELLHSVYFSNDILKTSTHHHDCHQLIFILAGEAEICVNGETYKAKSGNIVIISRYENHSVKILTDSYSRFVLRLRPTTATEQSKIFSLLSNRPIGFNNIVDTSGNFEKFKLLFEEILKESNSQESLAEEMLVSLINQLLINIVRLLPQRKNYFDEHSLELVLNIQKKFEENYGLNYTLENLAKEYNMSISSLSHQFKRITGVSVMEYLLSCRIANAKNFLAKTDLPISEIIDICGFSDSSCHCVVPCVTLFI